MSFDLMVFDKEAAPQNKADFIQWYEKQTEWTEDHDYEDPAHTTVALRNWFMDMISVFPPLNGPYAIGDIDDPKTTDYGVGTKVIYAAFSFSEAKAACHTAKAFAVKHNVGLFDPQQ